ncbi:hypothetical protein EHS25_007164 [Saitozyma podzolica]|uniref:Major facilitator superfamily (MFS) profile domain-containing protein n=1 Tax=Saitozyma podzolica TaxID=1890683 RepID=A0A427XPC5_9TREE|nr:hypothetical protein EHS25_007164 [Saitozyma podzolica]
MASNDRPELRTVESKGFGDDAELQMGRVLARLFDPVSTYPKIVIWCMFLCLLIIGIQYVQTVMGAYYVLPAFQQRYGNYVGGKWVIPAQWQSAIFMAGYLGQVIGALGVAAWPLDRFGPRRTLTVAVAAVVGCIFIQFFSQTIELSPLPLRGILSSYANLCAVTGQFIL